jgi:hypothetical protein
MSIFSKFSEGFRKAGELVSDVVTKPSLGNVVAVVAPVPYVLYKGTRFTIESLSSEDESQAAPMLAGLYDNYINKKISEEEMVRSMKEAQRNAHSRVRGLYHFFMAVILLNKAQNAEEKSRLYNDAMTHFKAAAETESLNELIKLFEKYNLDFSFDGKTITFETISFFVHYKMGNYYEQKNDKWRARAEYIYVMESTDYNYKDYAQDGYRRMTDMLKKEFVDIPVGSRQYILFAQNEDKLAGVYDKENLIRWIFTIDDYPENLSFSTQRPEANRLYILHPCRENFYIAYDNFDEYIFNDKIKEFSYLCRCLGATSIEYESVKGSDINQSSLLNIDAGLGGSYKAFEGDIGVKYGKKQGEQQKVSSRSFLKYKFPPLKTKAAIPDGLVWSQDPEEKELINMFSQGNLEERVWFFNSKQFSQRNKSVTVDVKTSFGIMMTKVSPHFSWEKDTTFSQQEEKEWKLVVSFKSEDLGLIDRIKAWFKHLFGIK